MYNMNPYIQGAFALLMVMPLGFAAPTESNSIGFEAMKEFMSAKLKVSSHVIPKGPAVYPGPGLPSLESLGLTAANLFDNDYMNAYIVNMTTHTTHAATKRSPLVASNAAPIFQDLNKRFPDQCLDGFDGVGFGTQVGITACVNYLTALGTQECVANSGGSDFCYAVNDGFTSYISGVADDVPSASSYCRDVATGAATGFYTCVWCPQNWGDCVAQSVNAAHGNGHLAVFNWGTAQPLPP